MLYQPMETALEIGPDVTLSLLLLAALFLLAVPVWVSLGISALVMLWLTDVLPLSLLGESLFSGVDHYALIAIPLYLLTGDALVRTGLSKQLLDVAEATMGSLRSGMGTSTVLGCGFFSSISGSDAAGCAAVGRMTYSRLVEKGYPRAYASALVASGACTGILIPPSIAYIIIGMILGISAASLFLAAIVPGILVLIAIMITNVALNRIHGYEDSGAPFSFRRWRLAVWEGKFALAIPFIILGGIYSGIFTPTEAAAVAVLVTLIVGFAQRTLRFADIPEMLWSSAKVNGIIVPIIAVALPLAQALTLVHVPQGFAGLIRSLTDDPTYIILLMLAVFIVAGAVMEATPNIVILAPIMFPLAQEIGMNDIQFCIFMITALGVGFITPPLGLNLFVISSVTGDPILSVAARALPYVIAILIVVLLIAFVPTLSLWWI